MRNIKTLIKLGDINPGHNKYDGSTVYGVGGVAPTIAARDYKGAKLILSVLVMKAIDVGFIEHGTGRHQSNTVWHSGGVCPCISTLKDGGTQQIKVLVNGSKSNSADG